MPYLPRFMRIGLVSLFPIVVACAKPAEPTAPVSVLSVEWVGSATGRFSAPATASWCARDSLLEVLAIQNDTGVALSLLVQDSVRPAQHLILTPAVNADWRPMGLVAIRWASDTAVKGFGSTGGQVSITEATEGTVTGTIDVRLQRNEGPDTLHLIGSFSAVPVLAAVGQCGRVISLDRGGP